MLSHPSLTSLSPTALLPLPAASYDERGQLIAPPSFDDEDASSQSDDDSPSLPSTTPSTPQSPTDETNTFNNARSTLPSLLAALPPLTSAFTTFTVYQTRTRMFVVGTQLNGAHSVIKLDRTSVELSIDADSVEYSDADLSSLIEMIRLGNQVAGGIERIASATALLGFVRFLHGWHILVVTGHELVGHIGDHNVYTITDTQLIPITHPSVHPDTADSSFLKRIRSYDHKYRTLFNCMDLSKNFYYSYTYDLTHTLQHNMITCGHGGRTTTPNDMYIWNSHLQGRSGYDAGFTLKSLPRATDWLMNIIHGFYGQTTLSVFGRPVSLTLISRRSRHYAGTRYLKRGLNDRGHTANDVETEQILYDFVTQQYTSHVQMRASIPVHWTQESNPIIAQPAIVIQKVDPLHLSTRTHIQDLWRRYGSPLLALNLTKQHERRKRECIIGTAFGESIQFINQFLPAQHAIDYLAWDFKKVSKSKTMSVVDELAVIGHWSLQRTGLFHSHPRPDAWMMLPHYTIGLRATRESLKPWVHSLPIRKQAERRPLTAAAMKKALKSTNDEHFNFNAKTAATGADVAQSAAKPAATPLSSPKPMIRTSSSDPDSSLPFRNTASIQRGVTRSNCIDSLDRTNVAAFCIGKCALTYQLHALGLCDGGSEGSSNDLVVILLDMYEQMGDALALQYGGSQMHRQMKRDRVKTVSMAPVLYRTKESTKPKEMFVSLMRHYQNTFVDTGKQDAINLFLGLFNPTQHNVEIWEMSSDYYLHNPMSTIQADLQLRQSGLKARSLISYANADWWKRPIAEYEQTLGQFASAQVISLSLTPKMSPVQSTSRLMRTSPASQSSTPAHNNALQRPSSMRTHRPPHLNSHLRSLSLTIQQSPSPSAKQSRSVQQQRRTLSTTSFGPAPGATTGPNISPLKLSATPDAIRSRSISSQSSAQAPTNVSAEAVPERRDPATRELHFLTLYGPTDEMSSFDDLLQSSLYRQRAVVICSNKPNDRTILAPNGTLNQRKSPLKHRQTMSTDSHALTSTPTATPTLSQRIRMGLSLRANRGEDNNAVGTDDVVADDYDDTDDRIDAALILSERLRRHYFIGTDYAVALPAIEDLTHNDTALKTFLQSYVRITDDAFVVPENDITSAELTLMAYMNQEAEDKRRIIRAQAEAEWDQEAEDHVEHNGTAYGEHQQHDKTVTKPTSHIATISVGNVPGVEFLDLTPPPPPFETMISGVNPVRYPSVEIDSLHPLIADDIYTSLFPAASPHAQPFRYYHEYSFVSGQCETLLKSAFETVTADQHNTDVTATQYMQTHSNQTDVNSADINADNEQIYRHYVALQAVTI